MTRVPKARSNGSDSETEWTSSEDLRGRPLYNVSQVHRCYKHNGRRYYLVKWEPSEKQACNLPHSLLASFHCQHCALVTSAFFE